MRRYSLACLVLVLGICISGVLAGLFLRMERAMLQAEVRKQAENRAELLEKHVLRSMEVLYSIRSLFGATEAVSRQEFADFVASALSRQPELQALAWDPWVRGEERSLWEEKAKSEGYHSFGFTEETEEHKIVPAGKRDEYFPVFYLETLEKNVGAFGFDVGSEKRRKAALEEARQTDRVSATGPIALAQGELGFLVFLPVYEGRTNAKFSGFAVAVFRIHDLVASSLRSDDFGVSIVDEKEHLPIYSQQPSGAASMEFSTPMNVAGRTWLLKFRPSSAFLVERETHWAMVIFLGGLSCSILVALNMLTAVRANEALKNEIAVRTNAEETAAAANRAKSYFLANMSHEIRSPMNAILGYCQILERDPSLPPFTRDAVATISSSGHHLLRLLDEILDLSKIESGQMELRTSTFDLTDFLREIAAMFQQRCDEKSVQLVVLRSVREMRVSGDEGKLRQVLINLLANAVKFTDKGRIAIQSETGSAPGLVRFAVQDTGAGIAPQLLESIFNPFVQATGTADRGGTGLGLTIASRQVELMGGKLKVESTLGVGSHFYFEIPLPAGAAAGEVPEPAVKRLLPGCTVSALVVDDIEDNRSVLRYLLEDIGCSVVTDTNAKDAMLRLETHTSDVVFLDMRMPEMNGIEATKRIVGLFGEKVPKIVLMSASVMQEEREACLKAGCDEFLSKPIRAAHVFRCLQNLLGVEFEYETIQLKNPEEPLDFSKIVLPEDLSLRMLMAAELHSATVMKSCLRELASLGITEERLSDHLRGFLSSYDMESILKLISQIPVAKGDAEMAGPGGNAT